MMLNKHDLLARLSYCNNLQSEYDTFHQRTQAGWNKQYV